MWSPMNTDSHYCNIQDQISDNESVLSYWRHRLALRKKFAETVIFGDFEAVEKTLDNGAVFAYWRKPLVDENAKARGEDVVGVRDILVVLNLSNEDGVKFEMPSGKDEERRKYFVLNQTYVMASAVARPKGIVYNGEKVILGAYQGLVYGY